MNRLRPFLVVLALPWLLASTPAPLPSPIPAPVPTPLEPNVVLQRYAEALTKIAAPPALIFDYTVEQVGLHDIEQTHRIYRGRGMERDETLAIDGRKLAAPVVRVIAGAVTHYNLLTVAPRSDRYTLTFLKTQREDGHFNYLFRAAHRVPTVFAVDGMTIDGITFLPTVMTFSTVAGSIKSTGKLVYGEIAGYRLIREASVSAVVGGKVARERIIWTEYQFPASLPASTFVSSREKSFHPLLSVK
jgi:hypothetical protein